MAKASDKRIASANETALSNLRLGILIVNLLAPLLRFLLSLITSRSFVPSKKVIFLHFVTFGATIFVWRWFTLIGTPKRNGGNVRAGDDLGGKGVIELAWDLIYMTWICTIFSALIGDWVWWFLILIPAFGAYKAFTLVRPILAMFLPGIFGPKVPKDETVTQQGGAAGAQAEGEPGESRKQAKLRARMEKGDKRIQQVQRRQ